MKNGIYDISNEDYHKSEGISRSGIMKILDAPIFYKNVYIDNKKDRQTPAMIFGNALHTRVLEPELFNKDYYCLPKIDRRTNDGKADYAKALMMAEGKNLLKFEEIELINIFGKSIENNEEAVGLLKNTSHEKSIYWTDEETGVLCKARPDFMFLSDSISYIGDIKTTKNAAPKNFQRDMYEYGYHIQAAMICESLKNVKGLVIEDFYYLIVEKIEPYMTAIYKINAEALEYGHKQFKKGLKILKECQENDNWPGYPIQELGLPAWAYYN